MFSGSQITRLGNSGIARHLYGLFTGKAETVIAPPEEAPAYSGINRAASFKTAGRTLSISGNNRKATIQTKTRTYQ